MQNTTSSHNDYVRIWTEYFDHKVFLWGQGAKKTQYSQLFISLFLGFVINLAPFYSVWNSGVFTYKSAVDWTSVPKKCHLLKERLLRLPPCFLLFPFNWRKYKYGCSGPLPSPSATSLGSLFLEWPTWWYNYTLSWTTGLIFANCWSWYPRPEQETRSWTQQHTLTTPPPWTGEGVSWRPFITASQTHACLMHTVLISGIDSPLPCHPLSLLSYLLPVFCKF